MVFRWREDHTSLFLNCFQNHECLWNTKCEAYKNKNKRDKAMEEMIKELNLPLLSIEDIKCKIKTIRTRYSSELTKIIKSEKSGAGPDDMYEPKLYWFRQADAFLRSVCIPRIITSSEILTRWKEDDNEQEGEPGIDIEIDDSIQTSLENMGVQLDFENQKEERIPQKTVQTPPIRKRTSTYAGFETIDRAINKPSKVSTDIKEEENEFDIFCRSLALQLKNMPLDHALICQQRLQNVMTEERMHLYRMQQLQVQVAGSTSPISHYPSSHSTPSPSH